MKTNWIVLAHALLVCCPASWATTVTGTPAPSAASSRSSVAPEAAASQADDSSSMREGVITAVNDRRDQIEINGSWLKLVAGKTQVFRKGRSAQLDELEKGQKVRFTLAPGMADRATLGAVYVP